MFRTSPRRAVKLAAVLALAAGLLATGCGQARAGAAALVGNQRIAVDELSESVEATTQAAQQGNLQISNRGTLVRAVLSREITNALFDAAARRKGITVTRGEVDRRISQLGGRKRLERRLLQSAVPPDQLRRSVRTLIIQERLAQEVSTGGGSRAQQAAVTKYLQQLARDMDITVSPRYGRFSAQQLGVVQEKSKLSTPETSGQPTPGLPTPGAGPRG